MFQLGPSSGHHVCLGISASFLEFPTHLPSGEGRGGSCQGRLVPAVVLEAGLSPQGPITHQFLVTLGAGGSFTAVARSCLLPPCPAESRTVPIDVIQGSPQ